MFINRLAWIFLVGVYQEILGDMHNLFGDTDSVQVESTADGGYRLTQVRSGDTVDSVLRYVHFDPEVLLENYRARVDAASGLSPQQHRYKVLLLPALRVAASLPAAA